MSRSSPSSGTNRPKPAPRTPSSTTIRQVQRPKVQIPPPHPPTGAQPAINPSSPTALRESLDQSTRMANAARPRYDSYGYGPNTGKYSMPTPEIYQGNNSAGPSYRSADPYNNSRPTPSNPYRQNGRLAPTLLPPSPVSRSWSAEPSTLHTHMNPRTADAQLQRPITQFENVSASWGQPKTSYGPGETTGRRTTRPWEGSAFTVGNHVDVSVDDLDSGYGGSTHGHGGRKQSTPARRSDDVDKRQQQEWIKNRWGMDSETSFDTASNVSINR
jgi:hypothetical protein